MERVIADRRKPLLVNIGESEADSAFREAVDSERDHFGGRP